MSNWKSKLKGSQASGSSYPQFLKGIEYHLEVKEDKSKNKIGYKYYDREAEEQKFIHSTIKGVLIGSGMRASGFDPNAGRNGSEMTTSVYFTNNDECIVYSMGKNVFKGTALQCHEYINKETNALKKRKELYVVTNKGSLISIKTSITLAIVDTNRLGDLTLSNFLNFIPREYVPEEHDKKTHSYLGKFASTNRPKYANIVDSGNAIDDEFGENVLSTYIDLFEEFKEFTSKGNAVDETESQEEENDFGKISDNPDGKENSLAEEDDDSDLPF